MYGQRALPNDSAPGSDSNERISLDPDGLAPSVDQRLPAMAYSPDNGDVLVVWQDGGHYSDAGATGIWGRVWTLLLFEDSLESGDTSAWTIAVP